MTIEVTVTASDFIAMADSHKFIFILFCEGENGKKYNIEDVGTKTDLCSKYGIGNINFSDWNETIFRGVRCEIITGRRGNRFNRFLHKENVVSRA